MPLPGAIALFQEQTIMVRSDHKVTLSCERKNRSVNNTVIACDAIG